MPTSVWQQQIKKHSFKQATQHEASEQVDWVPYLWPTESLVSRTAAAATATSPQSCRKWMEADSPLSHLALSHSRFLSALTQSPPHPASKKFRTFIGILGRSANRRLRPFLWAAWFIVSCQRTQQTNKCGQDVYLHWSDLAASLPAYSL